MQPLALPPFPSPEPSISASSHYLLERRETTHYLPGGSVDLVFTDPPYGISDRAKVTKVGRKVVPAVMDRGEGWDCFSPDEYLPLLREWVQEWSRVLRPGGAVLAFCDQARISHLWDFCRAAGLKPKRVLTWVKTNPPPAGLIRRNLISATEFLVWAVKPGARYTFNRVEGWDRRNVIETPVITRMERVGHPTQKPLGVLSPLIALTTDPGDLVLDPFAGSGSAGVAALRLGRRCHLIERHRAYFALLKKRLEREEDGSTQDISSTGQDGEGDL